MFVSQQKKSDVESRVMLSGKMTFTDSKLFQTVLDMLEEPGLKTLVINVSGLEFIDSAGLGMFFLVKEDAEKSNIDLIIEGPEGQVKKMFTISCFHEVFTIR